MKFQVFPKHFQRGWTNVIHLTTGGNCCGNGQRIPAVWFHSSSTRATVNRMHICSSINNRGNHCYNPRNIPRGKWTDVEISQRPEGAWYRYEVKINGKVVASTINRAAREFRNVKVYASDPWYNGAAGSIRNLATGASGGLETFSFAEGSADFTQLTYHGQYLTCAGMK